MHLLVEQRIDSNHYEQKKIKKIYNKIVEDYVLKLLIEYNYRLLEKDGGRNYQHIRSW